MSSPAHAPAKPTRLRPDRELLARLLASGGEDLKKCMQCGTCSVVCELADARQPGPRKEMLWAQWGLRDRLMGDADLWLCHQCGDCTVRCPRGARPGDVMAALRRECIAHYSGLPALARWLNRPASLPWLAVVALALLALVAAAWQASGAAAVELSLAGTRLVVPFWSQLPQWMLGSLFGGLAVLDVLVLVRGARRFWRDLQAARAPEDGAPSLAASLRGALRRMAWHDDFGRCAGSRARRAHHLLVVYGMLALWLVSVWVATARWNPLLDGLVYPLGLPNPWKLLANLAGLAVATGATLMLIERWRRPQTAGASRYFDLALLGFLLAIVATGFAAEALHLLRIDALRYTAYVVHLTSVLGLVVVLPYSKLAHLVYRALALVHAERTSRGPR
jgi:quinone-modifying oxidoreductase, subunit QmoC